MQTTGHEADIKYGEASFSNLALYRLYTRLKRHNRPEQKLVSESVSAESCGQALRLRLSGSKLHRRAWTGEQSLPPLTFCVAHAINVLKGWHKGVLDFGWLRSLDTKGLVFGWGKGVSSPRRSFKRSLSFKVLETHQQKIQPCYCFSLWPALTVMTSFWKRK